MGQGPRHHPCISGPMVTMRTRDLTGTRSRGQVAVEVRDVSRSFESVEALRGVSLAIAHGEIHALLGPNGAGKTTLLRILCGLVDADDGDVSLLGTSGEELGVRAWHRHFGLVPSGDRSFYLRLSGLENLLFFGRLHGLRRQAATERALGCLADVGLTDAANRMVATYSHGMQKRLSVARALLMDPPLLFVDEATHDLDPEAARSVRRLISAAASERGTAVLWATQRIEEVRGFADDVTLLHEGAVRFQGSVAELVAMSGASRYLLQLHDANASSVEDMTIRARNALEGSGRIVSSDGRSGQHWILSLNEKNDLGEAIVALNDRGIRVVRCREESSEIEAAFLRLVGIT